MDNVKFVGKEFFKSITMEELKKDIQAMEELNRMSHFLGLDMISVLEARPKNISLKAAANAILESKVYVSYSMSGKLKNVLSISTSCTVNPICQARQKDCNSICHFCFAEAQQERYYASRLHCIRNYYLLNSGLLEDWQFPRIGSDICRFESFGDIGSTNHFRNFIRIARLNNNVVCSLWSKNFGIIDKVLEQESKPENLILIQSSIKVNEIDRDISKCADHIFTVYDKTFLEKCGKWFINCGAKSCRDCMLCYTLESPVFVITEIKK